MTQKFFCFGLGYSASFLIKQLRQSENDWHFSGTRRSLPQAPMPDISYHVFDSSGPLENFSDHLSDVTHLLISIAPDAEFGDPVLRYHAQDIAKLKNLKWIGYLSTTGVYGDRNGDWVNDDTPTAPASKRGHSRLKSEQDWLALYQAHQLPVHLFRLGSIYGPPIQGQETPDNLGRGQLSALISGQARKIVKPGQFFSRIHAEDIANVLTASMACPHPGRSYNVVDDRPAPTPEVMDYVCDLLQRPHLPEIDIKDATLSPLMQMFYSENKRVHNDRIKQELDVTLRYPTYKEGFSALLRNLPK